MNQLIGLFFKIFSFLLSHAPKLIQEGIAVCIGVLWFDILRIRRRVAIENLQIAFPLKDLTERTQLARASLIHMGRTLVEFSHFPFFNRSKVDQHFEIEGLNYVQEALKEGRGVLFLSCHVGNGDYAVAALSQLGFKLNLISKEFKSKWLNELWFGMRRKHGTRFISPEKSSFEILRALKRNEIVIFVLDQFMGPPVGIRTSFFGRETGTAAGLALMADRTKAPVILSYTFRQNRSGTDSSPVRPYVAKFSPPIPFLDDGPREKNISVMTQIYTDKIQEVVQKHPEQWMWIHRRWKVFRD